jgi:flagellar biosynthesis protein FlhF
MQVKKFEAPTIQEALETIKRELGPEAIILQTKQNKRGFGLLSRASVEITAAISERSLQKKQFVENRVTPQNRDMVKKLPAEKQAEFYDRFVDKHLSRADTTKDKVEIRKPAPSQNQATPARPITGMRYIDIDTPEPASGAEAKGFRARFLGTKAEAPAPKTPEELRRLAIKLESEKSWTQRTYEENYGRIEVEGEVADSADQLGARNLKLEEEMVHLKRMITELKTAQETAAASPLPRGGQDVLSTATLQDAYDSLVLGGMDKRFALGMVKKVGQELGEIQVQNPDAVLDQLASQIMFSTETSSPFAAAGGTEPAKPRIIALVGPTGVGKTTTVAKMASEALLKRGLKVGLINLDDYKVAAFDQLGTYAKILNVPFRSVATLEDLKAAIRDFQTLDLVLVDTTGRSQRDPNSLREMQATLAEIPNLRTELVLSATTRDTELYDMANRFSVFRPEGLIISKLDEATVYGSIYNVSQKVKLPLLYFTTGQRVPEDIEEATRERVASLILDL